MSCSRHAVALARPDGASRSSPRLLPMNRVLIVLGAAFLILGVGWSWFRHVPLFRLPGDIVIDRPGFRFFFPITTMLLISALISLAAGLLRRW